MMLSYGASWQPNNMPPLTTQGDVAEEKRLAVKKLGKRNFAMQ